MGRRGPEEVRLHKIGVNMLKQITCMNILSKDKSKFSKIMGDLLCCWVISGPSIPLVHMSLKSTYSS